MIKPKKSLGQNFLIDNNILNKIIELAEIKNNHIVEIGPGTGNLTKKIVEQKPKNLILIEKDNKLASNLKNDFQTFNNLKIFNEDILKFDLEKNWKEVQQLLETCHIIFLHKFSLNLLNLKHGCQNIKN